MKSIYSYLFTAFYNWLRDGGANPRIMVDATKPGVVVPREYVSNDMILISIYYLYVSDFEILPDKITFYTKFKGKKEYVAIPYNAMTELVCSDNGISIPLSMWMASIDMACRQYGEDESAVTEDEHSTELPPNPSAINFSITSDSENSMPSDIKTLKTRKLQPKINPNFTMLDS